MCSVLLKLFVQFEEARDAEDAIRGRDGYDFDGHRLRVSLTYHAILCSTDVVDSNLGTFNLSIYAGGACTWRTWTFIIN